MKKVLVPIYNYRGMMITPAIECLRENGFEVVTYESDSKISVEELKEMIRDAYAVINGPEPISREVLDEAKELKIIAKYGVGTDNIDLSLCKERGIVVTKSVNNVPVAEHAVMLMLAVLKDIRRFDNIARQGRWDRANVHELTGKTVGILGLGKIGCRVAEMVSGFNTKVLAYDPYPNYKEAERLHIEFCTKEEVLQNADIITLHLPGTSENYHIISEKEFAMMKDGAIIINTARGTLIDQNALCDALTSHKLWGAGIDVFETEPCRADNPLFALNENLIVSPHIASGTLETHTSMAMICGKAIMDFSAGQRVENRVV